MRGPSRRSHAMTGAPAPQKLLQRKWRDQRFEQSLYETVRSFLSTPVNQAAILRLRRSIKAAGNLLQPSAINNRNFAPFRRRQFEAPKLLQGFGDTSTAHAEHHRQKFM